MQISVVIPAYEEAARLGASLERVLAYLEARGDDFEVLVVDDGSRDATAAAAEAFAARGVRVLRLPENRGKGAALRTGVLASRGRRVLLTDADLSTPIADLERLEPHLAAAPVVIGSRAVDGSELELRQPLYRELMGKTFNKLVQLLALRGLSDTQCGFKLLDGELARDLFADLTVDRFAYDVELLWLARRRGHRVAEVGVRWSNSPQSRVSPLRDSLQMLGDLVTMRWRHRGEGR
jgi:dolichyl-phosphate beta-glucosyltransferase